jgi:hypothetical protein
MGYVRKNSRKFSKGLDYKPSLCGINDSSKPGESVEIGAWPVRRRMAGSIVGEFIGGNAGIGAISLFGKAVLKWRPSQCKR